MATVAQCREALEQLAATLGAASAGGAGGAARLDRTVSCRLTEPDVVFTGRLTGGRITELAEHPATAAPEAKVRLALSGDDLLALVAGELSFGSAWASGRVRLEASFTDLLRLRALL
ncbi:SCP2 sterol-binding domain-containing protein [Allostreptomyces psammosilenae]|uniref:Sterol-binding protein n=1 Tax=Allostreptomyces psammosilenae TaxID=1892865 RepID=A0A852ZLU0_9ACTN|nr:SCP2 sterol-binding domain-containing protein [Allostreptomyces psammosilenae]NYI03363.1 hypothetical protein [Allostreptomyces psammosilenae]